MRKRRRNIDSKNTTLIVFNVHSTQNDAREHKVTSSYYKTTHWSDFIFYYVKQNVAWNQKYKSKWTIYLWNKKLKQKR